MCLLYLVRSGGRRRQHLRSTGPGGNAFRGHLEADSKPGDGTGIERAFLCLVPLADVVRRGRVCHEPAGHRGSHSDRTLTGGVWRITPSPNTAWPPLEPWVVAPVHSPLRLDGRPQQPSPQHGTLRPGGSRPLGALQSPLEGPFGLGEISVPGECDTEETRNREPSSLRAQEPQRPTLWCPGRVVRLQVSGRPCMR